jgi:hypothetical protein
MTDAAPLILFQSTSIMVRKNINLDALNVNFVAWDFETWSSMDEKMQYFINE